MKNIYFSFAAQLVNNETFVFIPFCHDFTHAFARLWHSFFHLNVFAIRNGMVFIALAERTRALHSSLTK